MMRTNWVFVSSLAVLMGFAEGAAWADLQVVGNETRPECKLQEHQPKLVSEIKEMPNYFAKVSADGKYMFYITNGNIIMDLAHPDTRVIVPGPYDPVPAPPAGPNHQVMHFSAPSATYGAAGMSFYNMEDVTKAMKEGQTVNIVNQIPTLLRDPDNRDSYQSMGVLSESGPQHNPVYRVLSGSLSVNDYDTSTSPWTRVRQNRSVCGNRGYYQLPMLSKNGKEVAFFDTHTQTTKIYGLNDDGTCVEKLDLGIPTGKVEFSYDGRSIAFHVDSYSTIFNGKQFSGNAMGMTKNIYVLNLERNGDSIKAGQLRKITENTTPGEGSYYPSFTKSGDVVYVHGSTGSSGRYQYSFRMMDPAPFPSMPYTVNCANCMVQNAAKFALGSMWTQICSKYASSMSATDAALWTLSLDPEGCRNLVRKNWDQMKEQVSKDPKITRSGKITQDDLNGLTLSDLEAACPGRSQGSKGRTQLASAQKKIKIETGPQTGEQVFTRHCLSCHNGHGPQAPAFRWDNLSVDQIDKMLSKMASGEMPRENLENRDAVLQPLIEALIDKRRKLSH
jgi:hypothetical protein